MFCHADGYRSESVSFSFGFGFVPILCCLFFFEVFVFFNKLKYFFISI